MYYFVDSNTAAASSGGGKQKTAAAATAASSTAGAAPAATVAVTTKGSKTSRNMTDKFTREEEITLIEFVSMHKCLYDSTHKDYKDSVIKENVWKVIAFQMDGKTTEDCKKRWRSIRDTYKRLKKNSKPIKWPLWNHLLFLGDIPDERRPKATNGTQETTEETVYTTKFEEQYASPNASPKRELDVSKDNELDDDIDIFYKSIALSVKHLPPNLVAEAKIQHLNILNSLQLQATQQQHTTIVLQPTTTKQEFVANVRY